MVQGVRAELAGQGTHVLGVYPGPIDTRMAEPFPMEKTPAEDVVTAVFGAVEGEIEDVYPDPTSKELHAGVLGDPEAIEKEVGQMLQQ